MAAVGGSIIAVSLKGRIFPVAADADAARSLGGYTNEVAPNGDGSARIIKTRTPWKVSGLTLECDDERGDQAFLQQDIADAQDFVTCTVELAGGDVYQGRGTITEEIEYSTQNATAAVTLMGPQKLERQ